MFTIGECVDLVITCCGEGQSTSCAFHYLCSGAAVSTPFLLVGERCLASIAYVVVSEVGWDAWQVLPVLGFVNEGITILGGDEVLEFHRREVNACVLEELKRDMRARDVRVSGFGAVNT